MTGKQAFSTTASLKPGMAYKITAKDLPKPGATPSGQTPGGRGAVRPPDAMPQAPAGFKVGIYVGEGLTNPRQMRRAPNGDYLRGRDQRRRCRRCQDLPRHHRRGQARAELRLRQRCRPRFGINFYPPGPNPQWVYVTNTSTLVRFPTRTAT